jgi:hypothetical protein
VENKRKNALSAFFYRSMGPALVILLFVATPAGATQTHGDPEGLVVHQISHLFFMFSMGLLIYWIKTRRLNVTPGWRYIQYAAFLFIIWTLDAFFAHQIDEFHEWIQVTRTGPWQIHMETNSPVTAVVYYLTKMDHLWCVPALLFMYLGLRRLNREARETNHQPPPQRIES